MHLPARPRFAAARLARWVVLPLFALAFAGCVGAQWKVNAVSTVSFTYDGLDYTVQANQNDFDLGFISAGSSVNLLVGADTWQVTCNTAPPTDGDVVVLTIGPNLVVHQVSVGPDDAFTITKQ